ncbi:aspartate--ammonia ligase [Prolixibacter bellariivorans]|uniref:Aspartate--ammonia ligase n=1 Tax=Prolixibacter bellariivorans TaxID=314319 RepID=A0A5M4B405_9BACT|nr:aspartate--ammonia ligase [Prolixibacter bellariivorans]GET34909.1 aspartate--ammonia ligase [Prolixibacter bellariivorans]
MNLYFPENYKPLLDLKNTEKAIKFVKDFFQENLSAELRLRRVTAPLFVLKGTGVNDDLNGVERPVSFPVKEFDDQEAEVVQSLAKWKRMMLAKYGIPVGYGIYTDMNAIRADEELSNIHSLYVDQWDWEKVITSDQRTLDFLKKVVRQIYSVLLRTEFMVYENYPKLKPSLPDEITFIHAEELAERYPDLTSKEREDEAAKAYGAVFIIGIGGTMANGEVHDGRAPDYDDWSSSNSDGYKGLNGDIIVWNSILNRSFELSSMGIRVDKKALEKQLKLTGTEERKQLLFHKKLLKGELPLSIGGGIGQSRLCMYFLRKAHIGEVQASLWPEDMVQQCADHNIVLV